MKDFGEMGKNLENLIFIIFNIPKGSYSFFFILLRRQYFNEFDELIKKENYENDIKI